MLVYRTKERFYIGAFDKGMDYVDGGEIVLFIYWEGGGRFYLLERWWMLLGIDTNFYMRCMSKRLAFFKASRRVATFG